MYICTDHHLPSTCLQAAEYLSYTLETLVPYVNSTNLHLLDYSPVARPQTSSTQSSSGRRLLSSSFEDHVQLLEPPEGSVIGGAALAANRAAVARLLDHSGALAQLAPALEVSNFRRHCSAMGELAMLSPMAYRSHNLAGLQLHW